MKMNRRVVLKLTAGAVVGTLLPEFIGQQSNVSAQSAEISEKMEKINMKVQDVFALITTDKMTECRDFYTRYFGFETTFETTIYLQMSVPAEDGDKGFSIAFMPTSHPFGVVGREPFNGHGLMLTIQVADTATLYKKLKADNAPIIHPLTDERWGQRRFTLRDPAGVAVDVVQTIEPAPGYYDKYEVKK